MDAFAENGHKTNGIQLSLGADDKHTCNGLNIGLLPAGNTVGIVTGAWVGGLGYVFPFDEQKGSVTGLSVGGTVTTGKLKRISIDLLNVVTSVRGITFGGLNMSNDLHGLQIGIINYAGNNPEGLRYLPFLNLHF